MTRLQFSGPWPWWLALSVAIVGGLLLWRWYWRESSNVRAPMHWLLPSLRAVALVLALLMLAGPTLHHHWVSGELSRIQILLDTSQSMELVDSNAPSEISGTGLSDETRWEKAARWLTGKEDKPGLLTKLQNKHHVILSEILVQQGVTGGQDRLAKVVWDSTNEPTAPREIAAGNFGATSPIGDALAWGLGQTNLNDASDAKKNFPAATILISDGQNTSGPSPTEIAKIYGGQSSPIFTIGIGPNEEPVDFAIVHVEHSKRVSTTDHIKGVLTLKQTAPQGTEYVVRAKHANRVVFERKLAVDGQSLRRLDFDLDAEPIFRELKSDPTIDASGAIPIDLQFEIESSLNDVETANNTFRSSLWGIARRNRVLLLDRRGRWETRYIKNALDRDPSWDLTAAMGPVAFEKSFFPETRSKLFDFDLLIVTRESIGRIGELEQTWLNDFVEQGGGLILIDSGREESDELSSTITELLPVSKPSTASSQTPELQSIRLSSAFLDEPAFTLTNDHDANVSLWNTLPVPKSYRNTTVEPGAETIVEGRAKGNAEERFPLFVTKYFGQGRVLYCATDETWRWRYNVADLYHQRFWNQIAEWTMRAPFAVKNEYVALDSGSLMVRDDEMVTIRAKLKKEDGTPLEQASAFAVLHRDGVAIASVPLNEETNARGFYRAVSGPWAPGEYSVRIEVVGVPNDALQIATPFRVQGPPDLEMQALARDEATLERIASISGGKYYALEDADALLDQLESFQRGHIVESQTNLWQSYPWFITIIILLATEWYLRKQAGLV